MHLGPIHLLLNFWHEKVFDNTLEVLEMLGRTILSSIWFNKEMISGCISDFDLR